MSFAHIAYMGWVYIILQVNVTADHRVIYWADLAQFLQTCIQPGCIH